MKEKVKNRWLIALSAVGIHISIGSVYAYSVLKNPIHNLLGWDTVSISTSFSIAILFLGMSAAFMGHFVEKYGPRISGAIAACFYGAGVAGSGLAISMGSLPMFYIFYGVIGGIGLGVGYISPVSTLVKWFPDKRGLATGLAIMGFGFAALIFGPIMAKMIQSIGLVKMFYILGAVYFVVMFSASRYLEKPAQGWLPEGFHEKQAKKKRKIKEDLSQLMANEAIKTMRFYFLWIMLFINITCGIALISMASPFAQEATGMSVMAAATMVGLMGLFNGGGRISWASFSDIIGRPNVYVIFFLLQIVLFWTLPSVTNPLLFQIMIFVILTCYGGGFSCIPAFIGDVFGTKQLGAIHGYILTAWSMAGIVGPTLAAIIREKTGSYGNSLRIFAVFFAFALVVSILMKLNIRKIEKLNGSKE
jgi:OFA family oxalate/formate antiporter-like MFS transporter